MRKIGNISSLKIQENVTHRGSFRSKKKEFVGILVTWNFAVLEEYGAILVKNSIWNFFYSRYVKAKLFFHLA